MALLPLLFNLENKSCLMIGGGKVASRRTEKLCRAGAVVTVISPQLHNNIVALATRYPSQISFNQRTFEPRDLSPEAAGNYDLVIAATDQRDVNAYVADQAQQLGILKNIADDKSRCDFAFPSLIHRDPITVSVSSDSSSPVLSRLLTQRINASIPHGYGALAALVGKYRDRANKLLPNESERVAFWESVLQGVVAESVFSGDTVKAQALLEAQLHRQAEQGGVADVAMGEVYLIGAGPGDPDLLTLRAARLLQQAEVIIYDRLVSPEILELVNPQAEMIYVGKQRANHHVPQEGINTLLIKHAQRGKRVARLKGGDPFIFGRGGEEIEDLAEQGIAFQVIPGITSASGCSCYAGIPLTHRDHAQCVTFVTGQLKDGSVDLPWQNLVAPQQTTVIYMGLSGLPIICEQLQAHGLAADTPAALVEKGTRLDQRVVVGTLACLPAKAIEQEVESPALLIIGSVVTLHGELQWYGKQGTIDATS